MTFEQGGFKSLSSLWVAHVCDVRHIRNSVVLAFRARKIALGRAPFVDLESLNQMPQFELTPGNQLYYLLEPALNGKPTFAFFNALTGETAMWAAQIAPALREQGFGTLLFNYRGQKNSPIAENVTITAAQVTADCQDLLDGLAIPNLVAVGLSIGGYFSIRADLNGTNFVGHVLLNTLRVDGPRLAWINAATYRTMLIGGGVLIRDLYGPLLFNEEWQAANRQLALQTDNYVALSPDDKDARLMASGATANWDIPWEEVGAPLEIVTGLQDRLFCDKEAINSILQRLPNAQKTDLADCGHMVPLERPQAVVDACTRLAGRLL